MNAKLINLFISMLVCFSLSACQSIKENFPDKTKEYQLSAEIPLLIIPDDLSEHIKQDNSSIAINIPIDTAPKQTITSSNTTEQPIAVDLVKYSGGATRIRIEQTLETSWRIVGKALSQHSIEITDRNQTDRVYFVQYDPEFKKVEDGGLWDEVLFIFGSDPAQEKELRVKLVGRKKWVEVLILDHNNHPLSTGLGLTLLNLLYTTIKQDVADE